MDWGDGEHFDPILHWMFSPICSFEVDGSEEISHRFLHNRLFGKNGCLLASSCQRATMAMSGIAESYELWLLEDMTLAVTFCCEMEVHSSEHGQFESAAYRYPADGSYAELTGDFDAVDFLEDVEEMIYLANHMA